jgi:hypothetical protein
MDNGFITARLGCNPAQGAAACTDADANKDGKVDPLDSGFVTARYGSCGNTTAETTGSEAATSEPASSPSNPVALIVPNASGLQSYERTILTDGSGQKYVMLTTLFGQSYRADVKEQSGEWCVNMANWGGQRYWKCTGIGEKY